MFKLLKCIFSFPISIDFNILFCYIIEDWIFENILGHIVDRSCKILRRIAPVLLCGALAIQPLPQFFFTWLNSLTRDCVAKIIEVGECKVAFSIRSFNLFSAKSARISLRCFK